MKNKLILSSVALFCAAQAFAYVEKSEVMTIEKNDGSKVQYTITDLDRVSFGTVETQYALYVEQADGEQTKLQSFPKVFLAQPAADGEPYNYGFSMVDAANPAEARQGQFAVQVTVSQLKMNETVDLAGGASSGVTVALYSYADGEVDNVWEAQTEGTFEMSTNAKNGQVTMTIEATFADGTVVELAYKGKPSAADDLKGLNPPFEYVNQGQYWDLDGNPGAIFSVDNFSHSTKKVKNMAGEYVDMDYFKVTLDNYAQVEVYIHPDYIGQKIDFATAEADVFRVIYGFEYSAKIDLYSKGSYRATYQATIGSLEVQKVDDNYVIDIDATNRYINMFNSLAGSENERLIFNYDGTK